MGMKYIVINGFNLLMFSPHIDHGDHFRQVRLCTTDQVTGAGFVSRDWQCYGESVSLGVGVGRTDQAVLDHALRGAR